MIGGDCSVGELLCFCFEACSSVGFRVYFCSFPFVLHPLLFLIFLSVPSHQLRMYSSLISSQALGGFNWTILWMHLLPHAKAGPVHPVHLLPCSVISQQSFIGRLRCFCLRIVKWYMKPPESSLRTAVLIPAGLWECSLEILHSLFLPLVLLFLPVTGLLLNRSWKMGKNPFPPLHKVKQIGQNHMIT